MSVFRRAGLDDQGGGAFAGKFSIFAGRMVLKSGLSTGIDDTSPILGIGNWVIMDRFGWHKDTITRTTPVSASYKNTQNVRRFLKAQCGDGFKFNRPFMLWIIDGQPKTMGDVADEWLRRQRN